MKKQLNIALLPAAVAAALLSGNVMAGTESCFENWSETSADWTAAASGASYAATKYSQANCNAKEVTDSFATFSGLSAASGAVTLISDNVAGKKPTNKENFYIAREVSKDFTADGTDGTDTVNLTYIPTTDIPGGSYITMELTNADFGKDNQDQIFLLAYIDGNYQVLATTDGAVNDQTKITFLSQSGTPIAAGTRLILSTKNDVPQAITFHVGNTDCSLTRKNVTLQVTDARTSGGAAIAGGIGATATLASIVPQYLETVTVNEDKVDAASTSNSREKFVTGNNADKTLTSGKFELVANNVTADADFDSSLPMYKVDDADIRVSWASKSTLEPGKGVVYFLADSADGSNPITTLGDEGILKLDGTKYTVEGKKVFYSALENTAKSGDPLSPMNFNYDVASTYQVTFADAPAKGAYLAGCEVVKNSHEIGVNGAVLKVPYMRTVANDQWIKITNESSTSASILLDVFNDKATNEEVNGVALGTIGAKETKLFYGSDLLKAAVAEGYGAANENTHTMTFVVTAPESSVHGVSVQTVPGKGDRVQPVLRNDAGDAWKW